MLNGRDDETVRVWQTLAGSSSLADFLPRLAPRHRSDGVVGLVWGCAVLLLLGADALARRWPVVDGAFRGLVLPVGGFLALATVISLMR